MCTRIPRIFVSRAMTEYHYAGECRGHSGQVGYYLLFLSVRSVALFRFQATTLRLAEETVLQLLLLSHPQGVVKIWKRSEDVPSYFSIATLSGHQDSIGMGVSALCFLPPGQMPQHPNGLLV